jgi:RimJ/RimL family protein N-acetyltransferase
MDVHFIPVALADIREAVQDHLATLPSRIDSFLEDHILASQHYRISIAGEAAGFASIHQASLVTQFVLTEPHKQYGQPVFHRVRTLAQVQSAFVPTCDEFFLAHALDDYRQLVKQAYFFSLGRSTQDRKAASSFSLRLAEHGDGGFIQQHSGEFFGPVERYIEAHELFFVESRDACVGFGLIHKSTLYADAGSIGMYTIEPFRRRGIATATIALLIDACQRRGLHVVAGCGYYNHASKKTLERAGMFTQTRLLKIDY